MVAGRPRVDKSETAKQLLEWAKLEDSIHLCEFCVEFSDPPISPSVLYKWGCEDKEFRKTYEIVKAYLGYRREEKLNNSELHPKAYDNNRFVYDYFQEQQHKEDLKYIEKIKKQLEDKPPSNTKANEIQEQLLEENAKLKKQIEELKCSS